MTNPLVFSGREAAAALLEAQKPLIDRLKNLDIIPTMHIVLASDDESSILYARRKIKQAEKSACQAVLHQLGSQAGPAELTGLLAALNQDPACHGILVEQPLPPQLRQPLDIRPDKDIDGTTAASLGALAANEPLFVPATAAAAFKAITIACPQLAGKTVTIVGRSNVIGKPLALMLLAADATVTICHSKTANLAEHTKTADIIVAAAGRPELITAGMVKEGAILIDVGTTPTASGLQGDIDAAANQKAAFYTPVPGGIGPLTVAMVLQNLILAAAKQNGVKQ